MGIRYQFEGIDGLIDWLNDQAKVRRDRQAAATSASIRTENGLEATVFEYISMVLDNSDLKDARFIQVDSDLDWAIAQAVRVNNLIDEAILGMENGKLAVQETVARLNEERDRERN